MPGPAVTDSMAPPHEPFALASVLLVGADGGLQTSALIVKDGVLSSIGGSTTGIRTLQTHGCLVLPGVLDPHVHSREPGLTWKEDWCSLTASAAAGGVCQILEMPNTLPSTTSRARLRAKRILAGRSAMVDWGLYIGATDRNLPFLLSAGSSYPIKAFLSASTASEELLLSSFKRLGPVLATAGPPVVVHAVGQVRPLVQWLLTRRSTLRRPLYIAHISTASDVRWVGEAKRAGLPVFCEVTPHHLFLGTHDLSHELTPVLPPLNTETDRAALWAAIRSRTVDTVASDHAPHPVPDKAAGAAGFPGVETLVPLMVDAVSQGLLSMDDLRRLLLGARAVFQNRPTTFRPGDQATLTLVDLNATWTISASELRSKAGWTPFEGRKITARIRGTIIRGEVVFWDGAIREGITAEEIRLPGLSRRRRRVAIGA
jgi:dihydroorotase-like cyclic amidohydrolase